MSDDKHFFQFRKIDAGTDDGILDEIIVVLVDRHDGSDVQSLRINGSKSRCYQRIAFQNIGILGNIDKLRFCRDIAISTDDGRYARFRTLYDSPDTRPGIGQELDP